MARAALAAELGDLLAWRPALPAGDWRSWVADSHAIRDRAAFLVVRCLARLNAAAAAADSRRAPRRCARSSARS